jgi:hypothetical protein
MLRRMGDEFVGVPREDYRDLADKVSRLSTVLSFLFLLVVLLIWTLITKGVLTSVMDLFTLTAPGV